MDVEEYKLKIKTSDRFREAGTIAAVCVKIVGRENSSKWKVLDYFFKNDFTRGSTETYTVTNCDDAIGPPVMLHFKLKGLKSDVWMCDDIIVEYNECVFCFPAYDWLEDEMIVMRGEATLPQRIGYPKMSEARKVEIHSNRCKFRWNEKPRSENDLGWGLPRFIATDEELPRLLQQTVDERKQKRLNNWKTTLNSTRNKLRDVFNDIKGLADFKLLYRSMDVDDPPFITSWRRDYEMGRQMLTGISPLDIELCTAIPDYCQVSDEHVNSLLPDGCSLESEMQARRIYIADYTSAQSVKRNKDPDSKEEFVHADCVGFFYASREGQFLPIAIQLIPHDYDFVFTPEDQEYDWLLAKMYLRSSSQNFQQWKYRYLHTNAVSETFAIATFRNLPRCHPVYKLLRPHLRSVVQVNQDAREDAIAEDSDINGCVSLSPLSLIRQCYQSFTIEDLDIPALLERKGLCNRDILPNFHYRDDALDLWSAVNTYVGETLKVYYKCDEDVEGDYELQDWVRDVAEEGFGWQDGNKRGVPERLDSVEKLVRLCTMVTFTSSVQHSLVNYGQMETYQFVPNAPCAMRLPPHSKGQATLDRIMECLPDIRAANTMISFSYGLCKLAKNALPYLVQADLKSAREKQALRDKAFFRLVCLTDMPSCFFTEDEVLDVQLRFREKMKDLGAKFQQRNDSLEIAYTLSLPENIPISIVN